ELRGRVSGSPQRMQHAVPPLRPVASTVRPAHRGGPRQRCSSLDGRTATRRPATTMTRYARLRGEYGFMSLGITHAALDALPRIDLGARSIDDLLGGAGRGTVEQLLPDWLGQQRWYAGKTRELAEARIGDVVDLGERSALTML